MTKQGQEGAKPFEPTLRDIAETFEFLADEEEDDEP